MSVIKVLRDLNGLFNYSTDENPTSQQDYQKAVKNWVKTIVSLVDSNLWQPETEYTVGSQLLTPSLPYYVLRCTVAGTSGAAEPDYTDVALGDEITDGTVTWVVDGYLPLSGGTVTGGLTVEGTITGNLAGNADTATNATNATNDANGNPIAGTYLPLAGGTMSGAIHFNGANNRSFGFDLTDNNTNMDIGWNWENRDGAGFGLRSTDDTGGTPGSFSIYARDGSNSTSLNGYPDGRLTWDGQPLLPVGIVQAFAGTTIPSGWLLCDGSAVSRTTYASLYACIGTTYGSGNGSTTFNLPNLIDKFVEGSATAGTVKSAGLPNITGGFGLRPVAGGQNVTWETNNGAVKATTQTDDSSNCVGKGSSMGPLINVTIDASRSSSVYGNSTTVQPPALTMRYIIKY